MFKLRLGVDAAGNLVGEEVMPWTDCKVAFGVDDESKLWRAHDAGKLKLPNGWELVETDCSGARCVAVFRVAGIPKIADGEKVKVKLDRFK